MEEEDSAYPALLERELHSLHRNVPALRRAGVDTTAIRQVGAARCCAVSATGEGTFHITLDPSLRFLISNMGFMRFFFLISRNISFLTCYVIFSN